MIGPPLVIVAEGAAMEIVGAVVSIVKSWPVKLPLSGLPKGSRMEPLFTRFKPSVPLPETLLTVTV